MAYNENAYKAAQKYKAGKIKRVPLDMQIAEYEKLKETAQSCGETVNGYIKRAVREQMERESSK